WDLVCESMVLKMIPQAVYMSGILIGSIVWGYLSDRFGRKMILMACYLLMTAGGSSSAFAPSLGFYCAFRSLTGFAVGGVLIASASLLVEWTQSQSRTTAITLLSSGYSIGVLLLSGLAYLIRDWHMLHLALVLPCGFFFLYSWWMAESARWLLITGKLDSALRELRRIARINGKKEAGEMLTLE
ncbi:solute carrier family 22 member 6-A-like, partial [Gracilinanus agilis]|uniref:solute carrier family 22 member 6-A-like n=1 Tax=Gracilinanus agilis TaxID=191870 RepID=UPI001CFE0893